VAGGRLDGQGPSPRSSWASEGECVRRVITRPKAVRGIICGLSKGPGSGGWKGIGSRPQPISYVLYDGVLLYHYNRPRMFIYHTWW
jgi:hypothetical protein